jgi:hypothetical protein
MACEIFPTLYWNTRAVGKFFRSYAGMACEVFPQLYWNIPELRWNTCKKPP